MATGKERNLVLLSELFPGDPASSGAVEILGLTADSRAVEPGYLFAALKGGRADGADFIDHALRRGAVAVLAGQGVGKIDVPLITDGNPRRGLARAAARFFSPQPRFSRSRESPWPSSPSFKRLTVFTSAS